MIFPFKLQVVLIKGNQNQKDVMEYLSALLKEMSVPKPNRVTHSNYYTLEATVICICHYERNGLKGPNPNPNFYGGSLSCKGLKEWKVMIALSCLELWTPAVAYAVAFADEGAYIKLPKEVISESFSKRLENRHLSGKSSMHKLHYYIQRGLIQALLYRKQSKRTLAVWQLR
ncbi:UNVERIFIED_CONTAM: hypothetical protein FKN15_029905 [Acipenser sinensis]